MALRIALAVVLSLVALPAHAAAAPDYIAPVRGPILRHFEPPPTPYSAGHRGVDFAVARGSDVLASAGGVVRFAGAIGGEIFLSIDHPWGVRTTYSYLSAVFVRAGASVAQGERVASTGSGHAGQGPDHVHFGAIDAGGAYLDPERLVLESLRRNLWRVVRLAPVEGSKPGTG